VGAVLTGTLVTATLEAEVETSAKAVKYNGLFSDSQAKPRKPKQLNNDVRRVDSSEKKDEFFGTECAKPYLISRALKSGSSALNGPTTVVPDPATSTFVAAADLMTILTVSRL
jgi:hypothetical protein